MIEVGGVYRLLLTFTTPPKEKYCLCVNPRPLFFKINSLVNSFIQKKPALVAQQVLLRRETHSFLAHDSWLDCSDLCSVPSPPPHNQLEQDPSRFMGRIAPEMISTVIDVVSASTTIPQLKKTSITAALESALSNRGP